MRSSVTFERTASRLLLSASESPLEASIAAFSPGSVPITTLCSRTAAAVDSLRSKR